MKIVVFGPERRVGVLRGKSELCLEFTRQQDDASLLGLIVCTCIAPETTDLKRHVRTVAGATEPTVLPAWFT